MPSGVGLRFGFLAILLWEASCLCAIKISVFYFPGKKCIMVEPLAVFPKTETSLGLQLDEVEAASSPSFRYWRSCTCTCTHMIT